MSRRMVLDLFAGPGGWDEGMRSIGISDVVGLEWDEAACATRAAAGHKTIRCDVAQYPVEPFVGRVRGLIASPPCQAWSMAGRGKGRGEVDRVHAAVELCRGGWTDGALAGPWDDERTPLILQPLRWAWALRDSLRWIACEQVPPALGVWEHMADVLRSWGYSADARVLCAADYGVPQTRNRAILAAHRDAVRWAEATHAENPAPSLFGGEFRRWVTMAEALGWGMDARPATTIAVSGGATSTIGGSGALETQRREQRAGRWLVRTSFGEPHRGKAVGSPKPEFDPTEQPCRTICTKTGDWVYTRPATSVCADPRIGRPGHKDRAGGESQFEEGAIRVSIEDAAVLQGFPRGYPWQGTKTKQFEQVGNAVPPPLAAAIIGALEGVQTQQREAA